MSEISSSSVGSNNSSSEEKKKFEHVQTYRYVAWFFALRKHLIVKSLFRVVEIVSREYKEARRLQRAQTQDVYKLKCPNEGQWSSQSPTMEQPKVDEDVSVINNQINDPSSSNKKPVQKVIPSRNSNYANSLTNGDSSYIPSYVKPSSPIKGSTSLMGESSSKPNPPLLNTRHSSLENPLASSLSRFRTNSSSPRPTKWNTDIPTDKLSFTMRREFEKAKEEAELIEQLRQVSVREMHLHFHTILIKHRNRVNIKRENLLSHSSTLKVD